MFLSIIAMKILSISIILSCALVLTGCFGRGWDETPSADALAVFWSWFTLELPEWFESINTDLVENKQIINQVLASYKKDNQDGFDENIVITSSVVWPTLDYEQFRSLNSKKLQTSLVWYTPWDQERLKIECGDKVEALFVTFDVRNTLSDEGETTYLSQIQYIYQDKGYIISYATDNEKDRNKSDKRMKKISCER